MSKLSLNDERKTPCKHVLIIMKAILCEHNKRHGTKCGIQYILMKQ